MRVILFIAASTIDLLIWVGVFITVVVVAAVALMLLRRRMLASMRGGDLADASAMEHLRQLHKQGKLSDAEYNAARLRMIDKVKSSLAATKQVPQTDDRPRPNNPQRASLGDKPRPGTTAQPPKSQRDTRKSS